MADNVVNNPSGTYEKGLCGGATSSSFRYRNPPQVIALNHMFYKSLWHPDKPQKDLLAARHDGTHDA